MSWHTEDHPELRSRPPWVMEEMIAAQPGLAEAMAAEPEPGPAAAPAVVAIREAIDAALDAGRPVTVIGCGTSEHGARGVAALLASAASPSHRPLIRARPAFAALGDPADGVCLAVSHDGGTRATELAALAARAAGATVAAITFDAGGSVAEAADHVLTTPVHDASWCHTIAYTSALLAGASVGGLPLDGAADVLRDATGAEATAAADDIARRLADRRVVLCAGAGADHVTARELSLKIAEGARLPTIALELETVLHGQLAGCEPADGLILVAIDPASAGDAPGDPARLLRRTEHVARAAAAIGIPVAALLSSSLSAALPAELTPAGRLVTGSPTDRLATLLAGAGALQSLTLALAHARGTNPDLIRREEAPYRAAAEAAEGPSGW